MDVREMVRTYTKTAYKIDGIYYKFDKKMGINESDLCLFYALYPNYKLSQTKIAKEWQIPKTTLNTRLKKYEKIGILELNYLPNNKKELLVSLTTKGKEYLDPFFNKLFIAEDKALKKVYEEYGLMFVKAHELLAELLKKEISEIEV